MTEQVKKRMPLVSVIIPTYNRAHTLPASIGSVLGQTYDNLEVIIVDDGSTDETENFVRGLVDDRVHYIKTTGNHGPAAARNLGAGLATGEYLAFQDSDDEWHRDKLEKQVSFLHSAMGKADMVYCEYTRYYGQTRCETVPSGNLPTECKQGNMLPVLLLQPMIGTPTIVVRRECFEQIGGFNETLDTFEDYEFTVRFSQKHQIAFVAESLVKVNDSPDSVDKRFAGRIRTHMYIVRERIASLREYDLLWEKLSAVQRAAEHFKCQDVFLEELRGMNNFFVTEEERKNAEYLAEKTEQSDGKRNQRREQAREALSHAKRQLVETYIDAYKDLPLETVILEQVLQQAQDSVNECIKCFEIPIELQKEGGIAAASGTKLELLSTLTDAVGTIEKLEKIIRGMR